MVHYNLFVTLLLVSKAKIMLAKQLCCFLIELGFNDTSTLVGHFVSSLREREKRDRRDSRGDERGGQEKGK